MDTGKKRQSLSLKRKIELIDEVEKYPAKKKSAIAAKFQVPQSTLAVILKDREKHRALFESGTVDPSVQRQRQPQHAEVDKQLLDWFMNARSLQIPVNGPVLRAKADELSTFLGIQGWSCSEGWLHRWKKRHGIAFKTPPAERGSLDENATEMWVENVMIPKLYQYSSSNIFNVDETALFWRLLPDKTRCYKNDKCHDGKMSKERITVLLCTNMDGTEKMPPLVVGKFNSPSCFRGIKELPVEYRANTNAWMTAVIFNEWLLSFDKQMEQQKRKVLLVLDSCSVHKVPLALNATEILCLPPNLTSKFQPCDAGIIHNLKMHYRRAKVLKLVAYRNMGGSTEDYQFTLLDAACTLKKAWDRVKPSTVSKCFRRAGFGMHEATAADLDESTEDECMDSETEKLFDEWDVQSSDYLRVDEGVATSEFQKPFTVTEDKIEVPCMSAEPTGPTEDDSDEDEDCGGETEQVSRLTVLDCVQKIHNYCLQAESGHKLLNSVNAFAQIVEKHFISIGRQKAPGKEAQKRKMGPCRRRQPRVDTTADQGNAEILDGQEKDRGRSSVGDGQEKDEGRSSVDDGQEKDEGRSSVDDGQEKDEGRSSVGEGNTDGQEKDRGRSSVDKGNTDGQEKDRGRSSVDKGNTDRQEKDRGRSSVDKGNTDRQEKDRGRSSVDKGNTDRQEKYRGRSRVGEGNTDDQEKGRSNVDKGNADTQEKNKGRSNVDKGNADTQEKNKGGSNVDKGNIKKEDVEENGDNRGSEDGQIGREDEDERQTEGLVPGEEDAEAGRDYEKKCVKATRKEKRGREGSKSGLKVKIMWKKGMKD